MINLQNLIERSRSLLKELEDGTLNIITRSNPSTWEELREELETELIPILKKLYDQIGGLMEQPTVVLPDGVTSTSLVSQSEMVQFVTNTLNTWLTDLEERVKKAREQTIFSMQPTVLAYKYVPFTFPIDVSTPLQVVTNPSISVSKTGAVTFNIASPATAPVLPTITAEKGA